MKLSACLILLSLVLASSCMQPRELVYQRAENFSIGQAGAGKTKLGMDLRLYNPNRYSMKLKSVDVDLFLNGSPAGQVKAGGQCMLPARDTFTLPVTLEVELKSVLPNVLQLIVNSEADVKLTGHIKAGRRGVYVNIPVNYEGKQDLLSGMR